MARIRSIKPELLEDERTALLTNGEWRLFVSLLLLADDYGNLRANPKQIDGAVFWGTTERMGVQGMLVVLQDAGLIRLYHVRGQTYAHLCGWSKHQKVDKPGNPLCPGPEAAEQVKSLDSPNPRESLANDSREVREPLATDLDLDLDQDLDLNPPNDPDGSLSLKPAAKVRQRHQYSEPFERAIGAYPRREEKAKAHDAWKAAAKGIEGGETRLCDLVLDALKWQIPLYWAGDNWKFAKYFERYLKARKWEDLPPQKRTAVFIPPKPKPSTEPGACEWHMYRKDWQRDTCNPKCRWFGTATEEGVANV